MEEECGFAQMPVNQEKHIIWSTLCMVRPCAWVCPGAPITIKSLW